MRRFVPPLLGWLTSVSLRLHCSLAWVVLIVLGWGARANAQFPDLVELSAQYLPATPLVDPQPAEVQVASYDATLNAPLPLGPSTFLIPGLAYHVEAVSFDDAPPETQLRAFHSVEVPVLFVQLLPADWALSARVAAGLAGDELALAGPMLRISGLLMATHAFSSSLVVGGGGLASYAFGSLLPLPVAYIDWRPLDFLQLEAFVPAFARLVFTLAERVELGVRADVAGNAYAIRDPRVRERYPCVGASEDDPATAIDERRPRVDACMDHLAYSVITGGLHAGVRLFADLWLSGQVGHTLFRRFEPMNRDDDPIPNGRQDLPNSWFVRAAVTYRLPTD